MPILFALLLQLGPGAVPPTGCAAPDSVLRGVLDASAKYWGTVGQQTAIVRDGRLVFEDVRGHADLEDGAPVTPGTRFFVASATKAFTGATLLRLADAGRIDLDVPIQRYLPDFPAPGGAPITARLLAGHLAGIRHYRPGEQDWSLFGRHFDDVKDVLQLFEGDSLIAPPGTKYQYSSYGYDLLAATMEAATGERFRELVGELLLQPLGLDRTRFDDVRAVIPGRARGYTRYFPWFSRTQVDAWLRAPGFDYSYNPGGGGLLSTARDLARFGDAVTAPGFLSEESRTLLFERQSAEVESPWSVGWIVETDGRGRKRLKITGSDPGFQATILHYPDSRITIAQVENDWPARPSNPPPDPDPLGTLVSLCRGDGP